MLESVHRDLTSLLRCALPILFRWRANEWAWRSVVAIADEGEWRNSTAFTEGQLAMLRARMRNCEEFVSEAGNVGARVAQLLDENPQDMVRITLGSILSDIDLGTDESGADIIHTALGFILDCCDREVEAGKEKTLKDGEDNDDEGLEEDFKLCDMVSSLEEEGCMSSSKNEYQLPPALNSALNVLESHVPLSTDLSLFRLFQLLVNIKPFIISSSRFTPAQSGPPPPWRIPPQFAVVLTELLLNEYYKRLRSPNVDTNAEYLNSQTLLCTMFQLLHQCPHFREFTKRHQSWQLKLMSDSIPKLLKSISTIDDAICLLVGVVNFQSSEEQEKLLRMCLLEVVRRVSEPPSLESLNSIHHCIYIEAIDIYFLILTSIFQYRNVGLSNNSFIALANSLAAFRKSHRELSAVCIVLDHFLGAHATLSPITYGNF